MDANVLIAIIGMIEGVSVALIGAMLARSNKKNEEYRAKRAVRENAALETTEASYRLIFAMADSLNILLRKAHGDKLNGEVAEAMEELSEAQERLNDIASKELSKVRNGV